MSFKRALDTRTQWKYPPAKRIEVVQKTLALGNMRLVSELTGVSYGLIRLWKQQPWWQEVADEIASARNAKTNTKLGKLVDKSLELVEDRLEHGDIVLNQEGDLIRKPLSALAANKIANDMLTQETAVQKRQVVETSGQTTQSVADMIKNLALEFAKFNTNRTLSVQAKDVTDVSSSSLHDQRQEGLRETVREVRRPPGSDQGPFGAQPSTSDGGEEDGELAFDGGRGSQETDLEGWDEYTEQSEGDEQDGEPLFRPQS